MDYSNHIPFEKIRELTGDGRDGFSSRAQHDWCVEQYLGGMCEKKRAKALIVRVLSSKISIRFTCRRDDTNRSCLFFHQDISTYERVLGVLFDETDKKTETAQFRWWVRRTFRLIKDPRGHYLLHENRPLAVKEQIYDILVYCHSECGHGGRDKTSAVARRFFSWIPKDVVSRFVSVCPGCQARSRKEGDYFNVKGVDGYYAVNEKVRELSIARGHAIPESYALTPPFQPSLATGMVKLLKSLEGVPESTPSSIDLDANECSAASQDIGTGPAPPQEAFSIASTLVQRRQPLSEITTSHQNLPVPYMSASSLRVSPQIDHASKDVLQLPTRPRLNLLPSLQENLSNSSDTMAPVDQGASNGNAIESQNSSACPTRPQEVKIAKVSKASRMLKPARKTQVRKICSKTKAQKKIVVSELTSASSSTSSATSSTLPRSQEDSSATSTSEDDTASKSDLPSPTQFYPLLPPQFDYSMQSFGRCMELDHQQELRPLGDHHHQLSLNEPSFNYGNGNIVAIDRLPTSLGCVDVLDSSMAQESQQSNESWSSSIGMPDHYILPDSSYSRSYEATVHGQGISNQHGMLLQQYSHSVDQSAGPMQHVEHNSLGIEFTFHPSQSSARSSQLSVALSPHQIAPPLLWSLSAPNDVNDRGTTPEPHPNFMPRDDGHFQAHQNTPYASEFAVEYPGQATQLSEQAKHRPPMLQLPLPQFLGDMSQQGPHSAPLLGGHFDYSNQRLSLDATNYPHSAHFDGQFPNLNANLYASHTPTHVHHAPDGQWH